MESFDLEKAATFANGHPFATYDWLRTNDPVRRNASRDGRQPYWTLARHADVEAVSRDNVRFTSTQGFRIFEEGGIALLTPRIREAVTSTMMTMDPPRHGEVRRPLQSSFLPSALRRLEASVDRFVAEMVSRLPDGGEIEFVSEVAAMVPIRTLCLMLGIPDEDVGKVFDWTNRLVGTSDPDYAQSQASSTEVFEEVFDYGLSLFEKRMAAPEDDLLTIVAHMTADGAPLRDAVKRGLFTLLLAAGNETTRNSLSGSIVGLSRFPGERRKLSEHPERIAGAVPELLRYVTPVIQMMRVALVDVEIGAETIPAGDRVALLYGAANADPAMFADPRRLDVERPNAARHLSFGIGIHHCLGARVAAMQLEALLTALLARFPDIEIAGEPDYLQSNFVCGIKRLPVSLGRAR